MSTEQYLIDVDEAFPNISTEVLTERYKQIRKWKNDGTDSYERLCVILGEEFGEVCQAFLDRDIEGLRAELIQVAAVCYKFIQTIDKNEKPRE